jgi:hypothetical protein
MSLYTANRSYKNGELSGQQVAATSSLKAMSASLAEIACMPANMLAQSILLSYKTY